MSLDLLYVLSSKESYDRFSRFIKPHVLSNECNKIITDMKEYYHQTEEEDIDWEEFQEWFCIVKHPTFTTEKLKPFQLIFKQMETHEETAVKDTIVAKYVAMDYAQQIADLSLRGAEGEDIDLNDVEHILDEYNQESGRVDKLDEYIVSQDITELVNEVIHGGLDWRLSFLNKSIGSLRQGKLVCFGARPNTGKTTWLASEATHLASQLESDQVVLWFNNEEDGRDVKLRVVQAAIGWTADEIEQDPVKALAEYESVVGHKDKIVIVNKSDVDTKDTEEFLRKYNAGVIIFDQLWKVHGFEKGASNDTSRLQQIFQWAREVSKKHAPVITVHQVKTEGDGVKWLTQKDLYLSGTAIQGEVDSLLMMGRTYTAGEETTRFLSVCKNKGAYGEEVDLSMNEGKCELLIEPTTAQFEEVSSV